MIRRALLFSSLCLVACCGPSSTTVTNPRATTSATPPVAPIGAKQAYATPPQETAPWAPPRTALDAHVVSAATKLFEQGLGDPRGCTYREIDLVLGNVWNGGGEVKKTHGWVFADGAYAVAWNGLVYRPKSVGPPADLQADVRALLDADDAARRKAEHDNPGLGYFQRPTTYEGFFVATESVTPLKTMLLLRLGDGQLARRVWDALGTREGTDAYRVAADDWLWSLYDRGVNAHMRGDVDLAIESFRSLPALAKAADAECAARGVKAPDKGSYFSYLDGIDGLLAEELRRARSHGPPMNDAAIAALARLPQADRIAKLIGALDQVAARQWGQPGAPALGEDPIVKALIAEGEPAVAALIDAFENDTRLTRSVQFWRDFARHRTVLAVYEAAYVALSGILHAPFFEPGSTGDNLTAGGVEARRVVGKRIRDYWAKWKDEPIEKRILRQLEMPWAGKRGSRRPRRSRSRRTCRSSQRAASSSARSRRPSGPDRSPRFAARASGRRRRRRSRRSSRCASRRCPTRAMRARWPARSRRGTRRLRFHTSRDSSATRSPASLPRSTRSSPEAASRSSRRRARMPATRVRSGTTARGSQGLHPRTPASSSNAGSSR